MVSGGPAALPCGDDATADLHAPRLLLVCPQRTPSERPGASPFRAIDVDASCRAQTAMRRQRLQASRHRRRGFELPFAT